MGGRHDILVVGSANMDLVVRTDRLPGPGETVLGGAFAILAGGKGANQAVAAARLGGRVAFIGSVGRDSFGAALAEGLAAEGIETGQLHRSEEHPTGVALIVVDAAGQNLIAVAPGANSSLTAAGVEEAMGLLSPAAVLVAQLEVPLAAVGRAVELARTAGMQVVLNPAPAQTVPPGLLDGIDVLTPNEFEAAALLGLPPPEPDPAKRVEFGIAAAEALLTRGVRCAIVTLGDQGVALAGDGKTRCVPAPAVRATDATAAGDCFTGALAAELARNRPLAPAVQFAVRAAALSVTRLGAQASLPRRAEVESAFHGS